MDAPHAKGVAIGKVGVDLNPLPALGPDDFGLIGQLFRHHGVEQAGILQPPTIVLLEQIAQDVAPALDVIVEPDKLSPLVRSPHRTFRQHPADLIGLFGIVPLQGLPNLFLPLVFGVHREGHELVKRHLILGICLMQRRCDSGEL